MGNTTGSMNPSSECTFSPMVARNMFGTRKQAKSSFLIWN